ncbi:MAG: hypothetical protein JWO62_2589 [Acidimicrobiaceae bacterium]|nr:hypothetical protein [Acidimicrobiaceae bacterium]
MPTSRTSESKRNIRELTLALCWGAWAELGVSGWGRTHQDWAVDPEPLIVFTATISDWDARLRDEALDWCIHYWRHVSHIRLRNILRVQSDDVLEGWGPFAATVNDRSGTRWPMATEALPYKATGRSVLRPLAEPSLILLRMRAIFGLGARSEILRYLLFNPNDRAPASVISSFTNYAKRNVADACEALVQAGILSARFAANRYSYRLENRRLLATFIGAAPSVTPDWNALFHIVEVIVRVSSLEREMANPALLVEVHDLHRDIEQDLDLLAIPGPQRRRGAEFLEEWNGWAQQLMGDLASANWPTSEPEQESEPLGAQTRRRAISGR